MKTAPGSYGLEPMVGVSAGTIGKMTGFSITVPHIRLHQHSAAMKFYPLAKITWGICGMEQLDPWKNMLKSGLTTFAEWDPEIEPRSDCHLWSASPCYDFLATLCGIMPAEPGFRSVRIEPAFGHLERITGSMPHRQGMISVDLEKTGKGGIKGYVILPGQLSGSFIWKGKEIAITHGKTKIEF